MGEEEKEELIDIMEAKKIEISNHLGHMPLANITMRHRKRIRDLEEELDELERKLASIKGTKKVYVAS
jgi:archaellum component FlaC